MAITAFNEPTGLQSVPVGNAVPRMTRCDGEESEESLGVSVSSSCFGESLPELARTIRLSGEPESGSYGCSAVAT